MHCKGIIVVTIGMSFIVLSAQAMERNNEYQPQSKNRKFTNPALAVDMQLMQSKFSIGLEAEESIKGGAGPKRNTRRKKLLKHSTYNQPRGFINFLSEDSLKVVLTQIALTRAEKEKKWIERLACVNKTWEKIINSPKVTHDLEREGCWYLTTRGAQLSRKTNNAIVAMSRSEEYIGLVKIYLEKQFASLNYLFLSNDKSPGWYSPQNYNTPLTQACYFGCPKLVELYLSKGADANMRCSGGFTPLWCSLAGALISPIARSNSLACMWMLCESGADVNQANSNTRSSTALHTMAQVGKYYPKDAYPCIELLLKKGANINSPDESLMTPLHTFLTMEPGDNFNHDANHTEIVALFLDNGASCSLKNICGETALDYAKKHDERNPSLDYERFLYLSMLLNEDHQDHEGDVDCFLSDFDFDA